MHLSADSERLAALTRELVVRWKQTRETWRDAKAREFEERFVQELEATVGSAALAMQHLDRILRKIQSDCE